MFANRVLVAVACCVLLASAPARADEPKPMVPPKLPAFKPAEEPTPKKLGVIRIPGLDAGEVVTAFKELLPPDIGIARFPLFNALVVWGTDEEIANVRKALTSR